MHQSNSLIKFVALLSVAALSAAPPISSKDSSTLETGNVAGTVHARIFQSENCNLVKNKSLNIVLFHPNK